MDKGVEDMSITFHNTIVHVLDTSIGHYILSSKNLALEDEIEAFITKHIGHLFESNEVARAVFNEEGELEFRASCDEGDLLYDDIGSGLKMRKLQRENQELLSALELYYRVMTGEFDED